MRWILRRARFWLTFAIDMGKGPWSRSVYVVGYPRSGTTWVASLTADYLGVPVHVPEGPSWRIVHARVFHTHRIITVPWVRKRTVYVIRDGRDAIVSRYFRHVIEGTNRFKRRAEGAIGGPLDPDKVVENLPRYIEFLGSSRYGSVDYRTHLEAWQASDYITIRYEDLVADAEGAFSSVVEQITGKPADQGRVQSAVARNSFETISGRARGRTDPSSFFRKGVVGDWRNHFDREAATAFDEYAGSLLISLGYEDDHSWVEQTALES